MIKIKNLIFSKQGKLLSIWRYLRLIIIIFIISLIIEKLFKLLHIAFNDNATKSITICAVILVSIFLDKEKIESLGIELKIRSFIWFLIGIAWSYFMVVQIEIIGIFTIKSDFYLVNPFSKSAITFLGSCLFAAAIPEELIYRSYLISNIKRDSNFLIALLGSFIMFTISHLIKGAWPNIYAGMLMGFTFTLLFGLTFIMTKNIFLAIGLHGAWNAYHQLFDSEEIGLYIILIVLLTNAIGFYLIYKKLVNFDNRTLINTGHNSVYTK